MENEDKNRYRALSTKTPPSGLKTQSTKKSPRRDSISWLGIVDEVRRLLVSDRGLVTPTT